MADNVSVIVWQHFEEPQINGGQVTVAGIIGPFSSRAAAEEMIERRLSGRKRWGYPAGVWDNLHCVPFFQPRKETTFTHFTATIQCHLMPDYPKGSVYS